MEIIKTPIEGLLVIQPRVFPDSRGYFFESYNEERYQAAGITQQFVQDNISSSSYGVLRGLHFQRGEHSQSKLVQVLVGKVWDVAVDLRTSSPTFGQWYGVKLSAENHTQFLLPRGMAHGFVVLSETAIFNYKCDNLYAPDFDGGIRFDSKALNIQWPIPQEHFILSPKDLQLPDFSEFDNPF